MHTLDRQEVTGMLQSRPRTLVTAICLSCVVGLSLGCDSTCKPEREAIVIDNGSFEIDGVPSVAGWTMRNPWRAQTSNDGAPGSGSWSLRLYGDTPTANDVAWQKVEGVADGDVLTLTAYVKGFGGSGRGGIIRLVSGSDPLEEGPHPQAASDSTRWVRLALTDTLSLSPGDSVWVVLSALALPDSIAAIGLSVGLFDDVRVVREGD
jgi:hypothetical protein